MKQYTASTLIFLTCSLPALAKTKNDTSIREHRLEIRHLESKGVGFNTGYSTVDYLFTRNWENPEFLLNVRGHIFDDGKVAGNLGMGWRHPLGERYLLGGNLFYDVRESHNRTTQQFGVGFECFNDSFDFRLNGYIPFGEWSHFHRKRSFTFIGNQVLINEKIYAALPCIQAEIGGPLNDIVYMAAGPYYLFEKKVERTSVGNSVGGYFRAMIDTKHYLTLTGMVTYDRIFKTTVQGIIAFNIPLGEKSKVSSPSLQGLQRNLRHLPIYRNEIIPLEKKKRTYALGSSEDSDDFFAFVFVSNDFHGKGEGTFEAPFTSLKEAEGHSEPGNIIYVFPGDGTSQNMNEGIILKEDQILASSSAPLTLEEITIPPLTPGHNPVITNIHPHEPVVQGPEDLDLSGFDILDPYSSIFWSLEEAPSHLEIIYESVSSPTTIPEAPLGQEQAADTTSPDHSLENLSSGDEAPGDHEAPLGQEQGADTTSSDNSWENMSSGDETSSDHEAPLDQGQGADITSPDHSLENLSSGDEAPDDHEAPLGQEQGADTPSSDNSWENMSSGDETSSDHEAPLDQGQEAEDHDTTAPDYSWEEVSSGDEASSNHEFNFDFTDLSASGPFDEGAAPTSPLGEMFTHIDYDPYDPMNSNVGWDWNFNDPLLMTDGENLPPPSPPPSPHSSEDSFEPVDPNMGVISGASDADT